MSDSVRPHRWQPTRLCRPWDSPGKNTGVGCHCLLHCVKVKSESEVAQSCPTLCDPMNRSTPGLPVHQQLLEFTETYIHQVGDAIQPSHPLSSPSPPAPNPSQHQSLFQRSEEHTSELQSPTNLVCRLLLEKKKEKNTKL